MKGNNELLVQSGRRRWFSAERMANVTVLRKEESWEIQHADKKLVLACRAPRAMIGEESRNNGGKVGTG